MVVKRPDLPNIDLGYTHDVNDVKLAESLSNSGYKQSEFSAEAHDRTAGWVWSGGANIGKFDAVSVGSLVFLGDTTENYRIFQGRTYRSFWASKALFNADVRKQRYDFQFPGDGSSLNDDLLLSTSLQLQHSSKLSTHYSYTYSQLNQQNTSGSTGSAISILATPTFDTQSITGEVDYQLLPSLRVFENAQYQHLTPFSQTLESQTSYWQLNSGVTAVKKWKGFDLSATYVGRFQSLGTSFDNRGNSFSNNVDARVGWGQSKSVRLTGTVRIDNIDLVQQIGGFSRLKTYGGQAETTRFWGVRLAVGLDKGTIELLNSAGDTSRDYKNIYAQLESRRIQLSASYGTNDGVGSIFPTPLQGQFFIAVPLPVEQLVVSPLLNINSRSTNFSALYRPKYNLEVGAFYRKENDDLISSSQNYRLWEIRTRYNIGRISMEAGFGNIHNMLEQADTVSGLNINRYWFRIRRTFNFF